MRVDKVAEDRKGSSRSDADEALMRLYQEQYARLIRSVWLLVGDRGLAQEIVQEAFVRVYVAWNRIRETGRSDSYLRSVAFNLARSRFKRLRLERRSKDVPARGASAEDGLQASEDRIWLTQHLRALPRRQRECLVLRYYLDLGEREIAETLNLSPGSVKTHLHRGLAKLAAQMGG